MTSSISRFSSCQWTPLQSEMYKVPPVTKRVQTTRARAPTEVEESRRLFGKPIPGNQAQSRLAARGLDQRNPVIEMSPIVLRHEKMIVILMKGKIFTSRYVCSGTRYVAGDYCHRVGTRYRCFKDNEKRCYQLYRL